MSAERRPVIRETEAGRKNVDAGEHGGSETVDGSHGVPSCGRAASATSWTWGSRTKSEGVSKFRKSAVSPMPVAAKQHLPLDGRWTVPWLVLFNDPILGNSALDRLANTSYQIVIEGTSYRERLSPHRALLGQVAKILSKKGGD